jgi:hypothetical protein
MTLTSRLGDKPVALIQSAWGGTRVEAWMPTAALAAAEASAHHSPPAGQTSHGP